ncbi:MAG: hypothetical protein ABDI19_11300 [Armatimonadota bacterium]
MSSARRRRYTGAFVALARRRRYTGAFVASASPPTLTAPEW